MEDASPTSKDRNLVILAGGIASRMKASIQRRGSDRGRVSQVDNRLVQEAGEKPKGMIGVGRGRRPFLDYLLFSARRAGIVDVVIVVGEGDTAIRPHYESSATRQTFRDLKIAYAVQTIPAGRHKPLGTADALLQALYFREDWRDRTFLVCNSDNLYSSTAIRLLLESPYRNALIDYDRNSLKFDRARIERFAVTEKDNEGFLSDIHEKPSTQLVHHVSGGGIVGVSMNIFKLEYNRILPFLEDLPLHPVRHEKELPLAVKMMVRSFPKAVATIPLSEHVPDLTSISDIEAVRDYLEKEEGDA
jgi:NDP-sugar pyrophosphorylase family protein